MLLRSSVHLAPLAPSHPLGASPMCWELLPCSLTTAVAWWQEKRSQLSIKQLLKAKHCLTVYLPTVFTHPTILYSNYNFPHSMAEEVNGYSSYSKDSYSTLKYEPEIFISCSRREEQRKFWPLWGERGRFRATHPSECSGGACSLKDAGVWSAALVYIRQLRLSSLMSQVGFLLLAQDHNHYW